MEDRRISLPVILAIAVTGCFDCPCLIYYGECGCRHYEPAHYSCNYDSIASNGRIDRIDGEYDIIRTRFIDTDDKFDGDARPSWCKIANDTVIKSQMWNHH